MNVGGAERLLCTCGRHGREKGAIMVSGGDGTVK